MRAVTYCVIDFKDNECSNIGTILYFHGKNDAATKMQNVFTAREDSEIIMEILEYVSHDSSPNSSKTFYGNDCRYEIAVTEFGNI